MFVWLFIHAHTNSIVDFQDVWVELMFAEWWRGQTMNFMLLWKTIFPLGRHFSGVNLLQTVLRRPVLEITRIQASIQCWKCSLHVVDCLLWQWDRATASIFVDMSFLTAAKTSQCKLQCLLSQLLHVGSGQSFQLCCSAILLCPDTGGRISATIQ